MNLQGLTQAAIATVLAKPEAFQKIATEFLASNFPSLSAAFDAYGASRDYQSQAQAQRDAMNFPALHATQPAMMMANQQAMYGGGQDYSSPPVHHHRRHHHSG
jgi:hypothetical protein